MEEIKPKFRKNLMHAIRYTDTRPKEPVYINETLNLLHQYVQKRKQDQPDITVEQFKEIMDQDLFDLSKAVYIGCLAPDMYLEYACALFLSQHPQKTNELLEKIEKENLTRSRDTSKFSRNFSENLIDYLLRLKKGFPELLENYTNGLMPNDLKEIVSSPDLSVQEKHKKADEYIKREILASFQKKCMLAVRLHTVGMKSYIPEDVKNQEKDLRHTLVTYISDITTQLKKFGFFERYNKIHSSQMKRMNLPSLIYSEEDLALALNPNYLDRLPIDDLLALGVFWLNRYSKELDVFSETIFAAEQFDLLPQMLSSDQIGSVSVPDEQLKEMLVKMHTLYFPCETFFQEKQAEYDAIDDDFLTQEEEDGNYILYSYDPLVKQLQEDFGSEYQRYFQSTLPDYEHDLEQDVRLYSKLQNAIYSAKTTKDEFITSLLLNLEINPNLINGGIILDNPDSPEEVLSKRFVGIALDCNLTTPMRQHIRLDVLRDFLQSYTGSTKVQIYEGNEDFREWFGKTLSNSLCIPFSKKIGKSVKDTLKKSTGASEQTKRYLQHLEFLRDSKHIPDHLKVAVQNDKGKQEKIFIKRYLDLSDGKIYQLEDETFSPIPSKELKKGDFEYDDEQR